MNKKLYDLCVKVGEKKDGKAIFKNIGGMFEGPKGPYLLLDRTFNPAGVVDTKATANVLVSLFQPRNQQESMSLPDAPIDMEEPLPF